MTTLQEYLNEKYPTKQSREAVKVIKINSQNPLKKIEGGELVLKDFPNLQEVWINWSFLKTPLTKWEKLLIDVATAESEELATELIKEKILLELCLTNNEKPN